LPSDFIAQLESTADAVVMSLSERTQVRGKGKGATRGLKAKLSSGRKIVNILDAYVTSALKDDPSLLAHWNLVKRVQKVPGRQGTPATPVPVPVPSPVQDVAAPAHVGV
jgi:hypothetical protein